MFKTIIVPVDLAQPTSWRHALPQAIELARASGGAVTVLTVVRDLEAILEGTYLQPQLEALLVRARAAVAQVVVEHRTPDVVIDQEVRCGSIAQQIVAAASERSADLILMASHRPALRDYLIGPVAAHVAQRASCSVLVLRRFDSSQAPP
jgi:nucleotide-binding universal stress UspA family protein